jgi:hypothetical protein
LAAIKQFRKKAESGKKKAKYGINRANDSGIFGSNIVAGVEYRKLINDALKVDSSQKGVNPLSDYKTYVVTQDNKMLVTFSERYAISAESSNDQQLACMRLLWVMLSQMGQEKKTAPGETSYPILKTEFNEFGEYNANYKTFPELVNQQYPCVLLGRETGQSSKFVSGLESVPVKDSYVTMLQEYCDSCVDGQGENGGDE